MSAAGMTRLGHQSNGAERGSMTFECHGTIVSMRADDHAVLSFVRERLPPGARMLQRAQPHVSYEVRVASAKSSSSGLHVISLRCAQDHEWLELARAPDVATAALTAADDAEFRVALHAPSKLFVHAAAVAWQGSVIVVPGRTCTGKSTLAAALVRAGAAYYSDEFAVIDEAGLVHPFARPPTALARWESWAQCHCTIARRQRGSRTVTAWPGRLGAVPRRRALVSPHDVLW